MAKVLIVLTSPSESPSRGEGQVSAGFLAEEFIIPYHTFLEHGLEVDIATPHGKPAILDQDSLDPQCFGGDSGRAMNLQEQLHDIEGWQAPLSLGRLALATTGYLAIFFPGSRGSLADLSDSSATGNMVKRIIANDGLVGAAGQGPAALLSVRHEQKWLFSDYRMTCISPDEEKEAGIASGLAARLADEGAALSFEAPGKVHVVVDRQLYTGQNTASIARLAWEMARQLKKIASRDKASCGIPCG